MMEANAHVLILGLGDSGLSMARWCLSQGARVTVADDRPAPPQANALSELKAQVGEARLSLITGSAMDARLVEGTDVRAVFKSPGLAPAKIASVWQTAQAMGLWVGTELSLFQSALNDLHQSQSYAPQVLAITGTNGKTTVTQLTTQLIERAGARVAMAGNVGPCLMDTLLRHGEELPEVWVLELSSFQLDEVKDFKPTAATVLNITQDHLDWHGDMNAYAKAKFNVFGHGALALLPRHDPQVMAWLPAAQEVAKKSKQVLSVQTFGPDMPTQPGDWGLEEMHGMTWLVRAHPADETLKRRKSDDAQELHIQRLMPADALRIRGRHNALNALAALALALSTGRGMAAMLYGLREYAGEPHRTQSVAVVNEVHYIDDSKGTNVGATVAALEGLGAQQRLVVILGGDGKGQDFTPLLEPVRAHVRAVVLLGQDAKAIEAAIASCGVDIHHAVDLPDAVRRAARCAVAGDAVLLSPACASLDMFRNYVHRAEVFVQAVNELSEEGVGP